jgi:hypothetical protein
MRFGHIQVALTARHADWTGAGCEPQGLVDALRRGQKAQVRDRMAVLKQALQDFSGRMLLYVEQPGAQPLVVLIE